MNGAGTFVAGDWGSTHLRLFLCRAHDVLEQSEGPGIAALKTDVEAVLFDLLEQWRRQHGPMPVFLAGMVGSRNGWREVPYLPCPADALGLGRAMLRFAARGHDIAIAPGLSCINPQGAPDVMRGEETQILGALSLQPPLARGRHLMVLPGTHSKWVLVENGRIETFQTSMAGELYALLQRSSLTSVAPAASASAQPAAGRDCFDLGLERCLQLEQASLVHLLFEVRTRQLLEGMSHADALAYLSGLIIGQDVRGALPLFDRIDDASSLTVIATPQLNAMYDAALRKHGIHAVALQGEQMSLAGLKVLAGHGARFEEPHALA